MSQGRPQSRTPYVPLSDLIGAPEPMSIEAVLAAQNGGYTR